MHRSQIHLEEWQYEALKARAEAEGRSISEVVRSILAHYLSDRGEQGKAKLEALCGLVRDETTSGRAHDAYLYGAPHDE
jgi:plasmid stability protein